MKALIVVDLQRDFCPGGAFPVPKGDEVVPIINELLTKFELVIFTKIWHPMNYFRFASQHKNYKPFMHLLVYKSDSGFGGTMDISSDNQRDMGILWPDHCVQNTPGADFHPDLKFENCKDKFYIFKKGEDGNKQGFSAFETPELASFLDGKNATQLFICGLAGDYSCKDTAIDAANEGFDTIFLMDATRFINEDKSETIKLLTEANVKIIESKELSLFNF